MSTVKGLNTFVTQPPLAQFFPAAPARAIMRAALSQALKGKPFTSELTKQIADTIRDRLKGAQA